MAHFDAHRRTEIAHAFDTRGATAAGRTHIEIVRPHECDRVAVMNRGRIEQLGDAETLYTRPASPFVCRFLGEVNELPLALHASWSGARDPDAVAFVRPHDLDLHLTGSGSAARVESVRDLGATVRIEARHPALAVPLVAIHERARFDASGIHAGDAVDLAAKRWVIFRSADDSRI
jgi:sulfate transport system ATP-binding protein